jgi:hypothetical protein
VTTLERAYTAAIMLPPSRERERIIDALVLEIRQRALPRSELEVMAVRHYRQVLKSITAGELPAKYADITVEAHAPLMSRAALEASRRNEFAQRAALKRPAA